jgi:endonuclease YncB( thermonuclease family)
MGEATEKISIKVGEEKIEGSSTGKLEYKLETDYKYKGQVLNIVDADTVDAKLDLGFGITMTQRFRTDSFDAPETWRPRNDAEMEHGKEATERAYELLMNKELLFVTSKTAGIYGRYGAQIFLENGSDYAKVMIMEGYAKKEEY